MKLNILALSLMSVMSMNANAAYVAFIYDTISNTELETQPPADSCVGNELTKSELKTMIDNGEDVTKACTGKITDFQHFSISIKHSIKI